jgi:hypothetical protein
MFMSVEISILSALGAPGTEASTRTLVAGVGGSTLGQEGQKPERKNARVERGKRVRAGELPFTGPRTGQSAQWLVLGLGSVCLGMLFVAASSPGPRLKKLATPLWRGLVRAAACGYPQDSSIFDIERSAEKRET